MKQAIVLVRLENTGIKFTGRHIRPDGVNYIPETESCEVAKALVWSRDMTTIERAKVFAKSEGYSVLVLPDTNDILDVARETIQLEESKL